MGRAHRQPQKKVVNVYHLLADGTSDLLVSGMARGKRDMLEAFLSQDAGQGTLLIWFSGTYSKIQCVEMMELLKGRAILPDDNLDDQDTETKKVPKKGVKKAKKNLDDEDTAQASKKMPKKRGKKAKKVIDSDVSKGGEGETPIENAGLEPEKVAVFPETSKETVDVPSVVDCPEDCSSSVEGNPGDSLMEVGLVDYSSDDGLISTAAFSGLILAERDDVSMRTTSSVNPDNVSVRSGVSTWQSEGEEEFNLCA